MELTKKEKELLRQLRASANPTWKEFPDDFTEITDTTHVEYVFVSDMSGNCCRITPANLGTGGGGVEEVYHDLTLTGKGTEDDVLKVADPFDHTEYNIKEVSAGNNIAVVHDQSDPKKITISSTVVPTPPTAQDILNVTENTVSVVRSLNTASGKVKFDVQPTEVANELLSASKNSQSVTRAVDSDGKMFWTATGEGGDVTPQSIVDNTEDSDCIERSIDTDTNKAVFDVVIGETHTKPYDILDMSDAAVPNSFSITLPLKNTFSYDDGEEYEAEASFGAFYYEGYSDVYYLYDGTPIHGINIQCNTYEHEEKIVLNWHEDNDGSAGDYVTLLLAHWDPNNHRWAFDNPTMPYDFTCTYINPTTDRPQGGVIIGLDRAWRPRDVWYQPYGLKKGDVVYSNQYDNSMHLKDALREVDNSLIDLQEHKIGNGVYWEDAQWDTGKYGICLYTGFGPHFWKEWEDADGVTRSNGLRMCVRNNNPASNRFLEMGAGTTDFCVLNESYPASLSISQSGYLYVENRKLTYTNLSGAVVPRIEDPTVGYSSVALGLVHFDLVNDFEIKTNSEGFEYLKLRSGGGGGVTPQAIMDNTADSTTVTRAIVSGKVQFTASGGGGGSTYMGTEFSGSGTQADPYRFYSNASTAEYNATSTLPYWGNSFQFRDSDDLATTSRFAIGFNRESGGEPMSPRVYGYLGGGHSKEFILDYKGLAFKESGIGTRALIMKSDIDGDAYSSYGTGLVLTVNDFDTNYFHFNTTSYKMETVGGGGGGSYMGPEFRGTGTAADPYELFSTNLSYVTIDRTAYDETSRYGSGIIFKDGDQKETITSFFFGLDKPYAGYPLSPTLSGRVERNGETDREYVLNVDGLRYTEQNGGEAKRTLLSKDIDAVAYSTYGNTLVLSIKDFSSTDFEWDGNHNKLVLKNAGGVTPEAIIDATADSTTVTRSIVNNKVQFTANSAGYFFGNEFSGSGTMASPIRLFGLGQSQSQDLASNAAMYINWNSATDDPDNDILQWSWGSQSGLQGYYYHNQSGIRLGTTQDPTRFNLTGINGDIKITEELSTSGLINTAYGAGNVVQAETQVGFDMVSVSTTHNDYDRRLKAGEYGGGKDVPAGSDFNDQKGIVYNQTSHKMELNVSNDFRFSNDSSKQLQVNYSPDDFYKKSDGTIGSYHVVHVGVNGSGTISGTDGMNQVETTMYLNNGGGAANLIPIVGKRLVSVTPYYSQGPITLTIGNLGADLIIPNDGIHIGIWTRSAGGTFSALRILIAVQDA